MNQHIVTEDYLHSLDGKYLHSPVLMVFASSNLEWGDLSQEQVLLALEKASLWHEGQTRVARQGAREPYINHPKRNMLRAYTWGVVDAEVLVAILLHDVVEDCADKITEHKFNNEKDAKKTSLEVVEELFSPRVANLVSAVTNPISDVAGKTKEEKRKQYADHLSTVLSDSDVFIVKAADFVDNAGSLASSFNSNKTGMFEHLYLKYSLALEVVKSKFENLHESFTSHQLVEIERSLAEVEQSLHDTKALLLSAGVDVDKR